MRPFGNDITNFSNNSEEDDDLSNENNNRNNDDSSSASNTSIPPNIAQIGGIVTFPPIAGRGVIRVIHRCEDAKENHVLNLSQCELMQIPDAVYHLMRDTEIQTCDLSGNVIKKVSPKFALNFGAMTELNLSHNQISKLPEEFAHLQALSNLNISYNSFIVFPQVVFKLQKLVNLDAQHNAILEFDTDEGNMSDSLIVVDLRNNPLSKSCRRKLQNFQPSFRLDISNIVDVDW